MIKVSDNLKDAARAYLERRTMEVFKLPYEEASKQLFDLFHNETIKLEKYRELKQKLFDLHGVAPKPLDIKEIVPKLDVNGLRPIIEDYLEGEHTVDYLILALNKHIADKGEDVLNSMPI